jgi:glycosyltransferase involved in cell wall biosynthesis
MSLPTTPVVSVIMSMRNAAATIEQAVRSLQWQTLPEWELILIDDGSSDASVEIVGRMRDPRIRMYCDGQRRGLAARLNEAVALARGNFIARMDADDVCYPERLTKQVAFLNRNPEIDLIGCGATVFANSGRLVGVLPVPTSHGEIVANPHRGFPLPHPTWCGRAEWFRRHPYDGSLSRAQDQDLLLRCYSQSSFASLPDILLAYRQERFELRKILKGRATFVRTLWKHGRLQWPLTVVLGGIAAQVALAAADTVLLGLGFGSFAQRLRLEKVPEEAKARWARIWHGLQASGEEPVPVAASTC